MRLQAIELLRALPPADRAASVGGATAHISPDRRQAACEQVNVGTERMSQVRRGQTLCSLESHLRTKFSTTKALENKSSRTKGSRTKAFDSRN